MFQLTFDIPLSAFGFDLIPSRLREQASSVRFLRFGTEGFLAAPAPTMLQSHSGEVSPVARADLNSHRRPTFHHAMCPLSLALLVPRASMICGREPSASVPPLASVRS